MNTPKARSPREVTHHRHGRGAVSASPGLGVTEATQSRGIHTAVHASPGLEVREVTQQRGRDSQEVDTAKR